MILARTRGLNLHHFSVAAGIKPPLASSALLKLVTDSSPKDRPNSASRIITAIAAALATLVAGCDRPQITTYRVPKEKPAPTSPTMVHGQTDAPRAMPKLSWMLPAGWKEAAPGRMSLATFSISGEGKQEAQVTVTPLPNLAGREVDVVNMWRQQVGQPALDEKEVARQFTKVQLAGQEGQLFEISGKAEGGEPMQIVTAMAHRPEGSWFYKLSGDAALVAAQKPAFIEFLKTVRIEEGAAVSATPAPSPAPATDAGAIAQFKWSIPSAWKTVASGAMQAAKFTVPGRNGAKAEVTVSIFPTEAGGRLANINRWRGQIGLGPVSEGELAKLVAPLDPANSAAILVDMTNNARQLIGAIVPRGGQWFYYKLMGDAAAVAPEKEAFVAFVKSEP
jgi:hypothetical protein